MERVARAGGTVADLGTDRNEINVDVDSVGENLARKRVSLPGGTLAALPGNVQAAPSGRVWRAMLKLDRPVVRVLPVLNDGGCHGTKLD